MIGMGPKIQEIPIVDYVCKEITILPSFRYANTYPMALKLVADYREKLLPLITHRIPFSLAGVEEAFCTASEDESAVKVVIEF